MKTDKKIVTYAQLARTLKNQRRGKKVVLVGGTFDMLHTGHLLFLDFAKRQGDILIVGVGSDRTVKIYKSDVRPIISEMLRMRLLAGLEIVDYIVRMDEDPIEKIGGRKLLALARPDVWVVPFKDHNPRGVKELAKKLGITLVRNPRKAPGQADFKISTTEIIKRVKKLK
ncbi:adenylyltransferase/cytidyltransferase family protein [Candidatus Parcubacteria bacterium]|nr:adenylyltransferase/cytidyltransferase family protein [Candidatus Parcubacteria bacterium]